MPQQWGSSTRPCRPCSRAVIRAALDELTRWGMECFSAGAMATRHGLGVDSVYTYWGNKKRLLLDVMFYRSDGTVVAR